MLESESLPFFQENPFKVRCPVGPNKLERKPDTEIGDEIGFICCSVAKQGYFGGDPDRVGQAPVTSVISVLNYIKFEAEYKETYRGLNDNSR